MRILRQMRAIGMRALARFVHLCQGRPTGEIWLFGGHGGRDFGDNSAVFFRFVREHHSDIDARWVANRDNPRFGEIRACGPVLIKNSFIADLRALQARVHVCSHNFDDIAEYPLRAPRAPLRVYLHHGFDGFKKPVFANAGKARYDDFFDLAIANSAFDTGVRSLLMGFAEHKIALTGFPNFDTFPLLPAAELEKQILYFPTWRDWEKRPLGETPFFRHFTEICGDAGLQSALAERDYRMTVVPHVNFYRYAVSCGAGLVRADGRIRLVARGENVETLIRKAALLVTDYSGMAFNFLYSGRPVVFFQPDQDRYLAERGSLLDLDTETFGPVCRTAAECVAVLRAFLAGGVDAAHAAAAERARKRFFLSFDGKNCERVFAAVSARLAAE